MRLIDADVLIVELEKDEEMFDKEAEYGEQNPQNCTAGYAEAMWSRANGIRDALISIYDAPTIDAVEVKHGHWEPHPIYPKEWDVCTSCGLGTKRREYGINPDGTEWRSEVSYTYCPWCGAKMDEVVE